jgi:hypothetical protein
MNNWFTVKVKYTKQLENGTFKRVSEPYMLAAMTFTDAEARIYEELGALIRGEFTVVGIARTDVHDIFAYDDSETWYKCKVTYDKIDDEGDKKKTISQNYLVTATNVKDAFTRVQESLSTLMIDFKITIVAESPIVEIFPYNADDVAPINNVISEIIDEISPAHDVFESENSTQNKGVIFSASGVDEEESESNLVDELDDENE